MASAFHLFSMGRRIMVLVVMIPLAVAIKYVLESRE
jgi:hypothetical protein